MEIVDQIPSIRAFMSFGLPPIFELEGSTDPFSEAIDATRDSYDPYQQNQVLNALSYQIGAAILSSSIYQSRTPSTSFLTSFSNGSSTARNLTESFLAPTLSFTLRTPDGPLSVGDLIDLFG